MGIAQARAGCASVEELIIAVDGGRSASHRDKKGCGRRPGRSIGGRADALGFCRRTRCLPSATKSGIEADSQKAGQARFRQDLLTMSCCFSVSSLLKKDHIPNGGPSVRHAEAADLNGQAPWRGACRDSRVVTVMNWANWARASIRRLHAVAAADHGRTPFKEWKRSSASRPAGFFCQRHRFSAEPFISLS